MLLVEARHRPHGRDHQRIACQRTRLIGAQHINGSCLVHRRQPGGQHAATGKRAGARAPSAADKVKVAGNATGIDASTAVSTSGTISANGTCRYNAQALRTPGVQRSAR